MIGKAVARHGSIDDRRAPSCELAHVELAGGRALLRAVGLAVDHQRAGAADALAAVVVEDDRLLALVDEALVDEVEHLEERHLVVDAAARRWCRSAPAASGPSWRQTLSVRLRVVASTCSSGRRGGRSRTRAASLLRLGLRRVAGPLPGGDVGEVLVVALGLALLGLVLGPEVAAAGLLAVEGVEAHQLGQLEEVVDPAGLLEGLVELVAAAGDPEVLAELLVQGGDLRQRLLQALLGALHAAVVPHDPAELHGGSSRASGCRRWRGSRSKRSAASASAAWNSGWSVGTGVVPSCGAR